MPASHVLGQKLDSIPFSAYHMMIILVLGAVGFIEGYDLALGGSLLVLAKAAAATDRRRRSAGWRWRRHLLVVVGGFAASAMSDRISRKTVMQIGVIISTGMTLLIPLAQTGTQLLVIRILTGIGLGFAISAPFPIAAELMPKQHRRTYGAIFEVMLASAFTLLPFVGFLLAGNPDGFRLIALPGGLALGIVPLLVHFGLPESARWYLRRGNPQAAVETVNRMIERCGNQRAAADRAGAGTERRETRRAAAAVQRAVRARPTAMDRGRDHPVRRGDHRVLLLGDPAAEGAGGPGRRRQPELRAGHAAVRGDHPGKILHRVHHGDHRPALDHHLLPRRRGARAGADGDGAYHGRPRHRGDDGGRDHHRPDRAVVVHRGAGLSVRAIPHRAARPRAFLRRGDRADLFRRADAVLPGAAHRVRR